MDVCDADNGEVVEEDGMFDMVYSGHCNKQGCKEVRPSPCCMWKTSERRRRFHNAACQDLGEEASFCIPCT